MAESQEMVEKGWEERARRHNAREWNRWRRQVLDTLKSRIKNHLYVPFASLAAMLGPPPPPPVLPSILDGDNPEHLAGQTAENSVTPTAGPEQRKWHAQE